MDYLTITDCDKMGIKMVVDYRQRIHTFLYLLIFDRTNITISNSVITGNGDVAISYTNSATLNNFKNAFIVRNCNVSDNVGGIFMQHTQGSYPLIVEIIDNEINYNVRKRTIDIICNR
jgi:hypothetical protein